MNRWNNYLQFCLSCFAVLAVACSLQGCSYLSIPAADNIQAKPENKSEATDAPVYNSSVIKGRLISRDGIKAVTLIVAYRLTNKNAQFAEYASSNGNNAFMIYLPRGRYHLYALTDFNANGIFEDSEISGVYGEANAPREISASEGELITDAVIPITRGNGNIIKLPSALTFKEDQKFIKQATHNGQILKIYSEYFSPENSQSGYWHPSSFMKAFGANIYLTEEYNPRKIPVLFVHGTEGSPYNWIYLYMRLDRNRYQPWFFYYPSGIRLNLAAALLNEQLRELHKKYGFQKMAVIAHSVGGLTVRSFINRYVSDRQNNFVKLFITFATPWSGFEMADASQRIPHKSIPVWVDLGTQSNFIQTTLSEKLSLHVRHYIFYGTNDKLAGDKALDKRAVACAIKTLDFNCTHDTILSDRKVFGRLKSILDKELMNP